MSDTISETASRLCSHCGTVKSLDAFVLDNRTPSGRGYICKGCRNEQHRAFRQRPIVRIRDALRNRGNYWNDPEKDRRRRAAYRASHQEPTAFERDPFKDMARRKLRNAVRAGKIVRPEMCEDCGQACNPHGHHEDYSKPLDVIWVCRECHGKRHRKYPEDTVHMNMEAINDV